MCGLACPTVPKKHRVSSMVIGQRRDSFNGRQRPGSPRLQPAPEEIKGGSTMGLLSRMMLFLKVKASATLDRGEDPRQVVEYAYQEQQEILRKVRQGLIEVATSRHQLEHQAQKLRPQVPKMEDQAKRALAAGREDLARIALERKQTALVELEGLDYQVDEVAEEERKLIL